jgi:hypothetical protein
MTTPPPTPPNPRATQPRYRYKIHDKRYDLTEFVNVHPGGKDMFDNLPVDANITPMVYAYHANPEAIVAMLPKYEVALNESAHVKYDTAYTYESYCELKRAVYDEIRKHKIPLVWTTTEVAYNACVLSTYLAVWAYCLSNASHLSWWWMVLLATMNMGYVALVFHETSHHTGFRNQTLNRILSHVVLSPFITTDDWKFEHNYLHHSFTNTKLRRRLWKTSTAAATLARARTALAAPIPIYVCVPPVCGGRV